MPPQKKSNSKKPKKTADDDDSSVDSRGNIRNLIEYEEEEDSDYEPSEETSESAVAKRVRKNQRAKRGLKDKKIKKFAPKKSAPIKKQKPSAKKSKKKEESEEEESEEEEEEEDIEMDEDVEEEDEEEEEEDEDEEDDHRNAKATIDWLVLGGDDEDDPNEPKKYKMKKESPEVRRFVEILQKQNEGEEEHIDNDITYFKTLPAEKKSALLAKMETRLVKVEQAVPLKFQILEKATTRTKTLKYSHD